MFFELVEKIEQGLENTVILVDACGARVSGGGLDGGERSKIARLKGHACAQELAHARDHLTAAEQHAAVVVGDNTWRRRQLVEHNGVHVRDAASRAEQRAEETWRELGDLAEESEQQAVHDGRRLVFGDAHEQSEPVRIRFLLSAAAAVHRRHCRLRRGRSCCLRHH